MTLQAERRSSLWFVSLVCLLACLTNQRVSAQVETEKRSFDVSEGYATNTLKEAAQQAEVEFIFSADLVKGVRTSSIQGMYTPMKAFSLMLAETSLEVFQHGKTGVYAITRVSDIQPTELEQPIDEAKMTANNNWLKTLAAVLTLGIAGAQSQLPAQENDEEEVFELSPFEVGASQDIGYLAANTLNGTRLRTNLFETPTAISVLTDELLTDINAQSSEDYLRFLPNADYEPAATAGNQRNQHSDVDIKMRGFAGAKLTRDYFAYPNVNSDRFNIERIEGSRGPNAVLYGIGGPAGVVNTSSKRALLNSDQKSFALNVGSYDKIRGEFDMAFPIIKDELALRVNGMYEDRDGWAEFEYREQEGLALASTYRPFQKTTLRVGWEGLDQTQNRLFNFLPFDGGGTTWQAKGAPLSEDVLPGTNPDPDTVRIRNLNRVIWAPQLRDQPFRLSTAGGTDMRPDIDGQQNTGYWETKWPPNAPIGAGVDDPYYGTPFLPKRANVAGPGNKFEMDYSLFSTFLEQQIGDDLHIELAYSKYGLDRRNYFTTNAGARLNADPNSVLPGAYYGDGRYVPNADYGPGTLLPDIGAPNPQAGKLYINSFPFTTFQDWDFETFRAIAGYELDLTEVNRWLGRHTFTGLYQEEEQYYKVINHNLWNTTPNDGLPIDNPQHLVVYRSYLDFSSPNGLRGAIDPWSNPIPTETGVTAEFVMWRNANRLRLTELETLMGVWQGRFLNDRVILTAGYRTDDQLTDIADSGGQRYIEGTNLWLTPHNVFDDDSNLSTFSGDTKTFGVFIQPLEWLALTHNQADSVLPESLWDLLGRPLPNRSGEGKDYGLRLNLLDKRLYVNVNYFENDDANRLFNEGIQFLVRGYNQMIGPIISTSTEEGIPLPQIFADAGVDEFQGGRDLATSTSEGFEFEVVGQIMRNWNISFNFSRTDTSLSSAATRTNEFHEAVASAWANNNTPLNDSNDAINNYVIQRDNTPDRDFTLNPPTFADAYEAGTASLAIANAQVGSIPYRHVRDAINVFTNYRFGRDAWGIFQDARIGIGANYRDAPVIGYDASNEDAPIFGDEDWLVTLMIGKKVAVWGPKHVVDFQLNITNLLGNEGLVPMSAAVPGEVLRHYYPRQRRTLELRAVYRW